MAKATSIGMEQLDFMQGFVRLCEDGWRAGYHECNGGNASYRLDGADVARAQAFFADQPAPWIPLSHAVPLMGGAFLLVTGSGRFLRNVPLDPAANCGIVELAPAGDAWRTVWGLTGGARPTSELPSHIAAHAVRSAATGRENRVLYHAHPTAVAALTAIVEPDARTVTRILWKSFSEAIIAIPDGIGVVPWMPPGSQQLADATSAQLRDHAACIWQLHGVFASGMSFDAAFGLVNAVDKAADAYLRARAAAGGAQPAFAIPDEGLRATAAAYNLPLREDFLDGASE